MVEEDISGAAGTSAEDFREEATSALDTPAAGTLGARRITVVGVIWAAAYLVRGTSVEATSVEVMWAAAGITSAGIRVTARTGITVQAMLTAATVTVIRYILATVTATTTVIGAATATSVIGIIPGTAITVTFRSAGTGPDIITLTPITPLTRR